jgi:hypothetical protein
MHQGRHTGGKDVLPLPPTVYADVLRVDHIVYDRQQLVEILDDERGRNVVVVRIVELVQFLHRHTALVELLLQRTLHTPPAGRSVARSFLFPVILPAFLLL